MTLYTKEDKNTVNFLSCPLMNMWKTTFWSKLKFQKIKLQIMRYHALKCLVFIPIGCY